MASIFVILTLAYYLTTSKVTAKASVLFATTASVGMLVMSMQNMGLIGMMTVAWPDDLNGVFSICQFLLLDIDSYGFSCIAGQSSPVRYIMSAAIFPIGVCWLALCWAVSQLLPQKHRWQLSKVVSCMGAFLQVGFSTMSATSLAPMMCYLHPNGQRSILKYPDVICGSSDHDVMLIFGWLLLSIFVLGFVAACAFAAYKATWRRNPRGISQLSCRYHPGVHIVKIALSHPCASWSSGLDWIPGGSACHFWFEGLFSPCLWSWRLITLPSRS